MARKRKSSRRRNPRTTGAIVVNPRRRKSRKKNTRRRTTRRRATSKRRKNTRRKRRTTKRRRNVLKVRTNRRRRKKSTRRRRTTKRRTNSRRRRTTTKRRRSNKRRRKAPRVVYRYRTRKNSRKRRRTRRRNPGMTASLKRGLGKIPLVGGLLKSIVGFAGPAAFGAAGVWPVAMIAKVLGRYFPWLDARLFYVLSGLTLASLVKMLPIKSAALKEKLAIGIASATGAIAFHKHLTGQEGDLSGEIGMLEYGAHYQAIPGYGEQYAVIPGYGGYQTIPGYGGALQVDRDSIGMLTAMYNDADLLDYQSCPEDLDMGELQVALSGAGSWGQAFPQVRMMSRQGAGSRHAGLHGHRWGWLIKLIGFDNFQKLAAQPVATRQQLIQEIKTYAHQRASQLLAAQGTAGWGGALMVAR